MSFAKVSQIIQRKSTQYFCLLLSLQQVRLLVNDHFFLCSDDGTRHGRAGHSSYAEHYLRLHQSLRDLRLFGQQTPRLFRALGLEHLLLLGLAVQVLTSIREIGTFIQVV